MHLKQRKLTFVSCIHFFTQIHYIQNTVKTELYEVCPDMLHTSRHIVGTQILYCMLHLAALKHAPGLGVVYLRDHQDNSFSLSSAPAGEGTTEFPKCITKKVGSNDNASKLQLEHGHFKSSLGP
jgi:hypothetical protein